MKKSFKQERTWLGTNDMPRKPMFNKCEEIISEEQYFDDKTARILKKKVIKVYDPVEELSKYSVSDFFLENLIACGAIANMKTCQFTDDDVDAICGSIENANDFMDFIAARQAAAEQVEKTVEE